MDTVNFIAATNDATISKFETLANKKRAIKEILLPVNLLIN